MSRPWRYRRVPDDVRVRNPDTSSRADRYLHDCWSVVIPDGDPHSHAIIGTIGKAFYWGSQFFWHSPELPGTSGTTRDELAAILVARTQRPRDEPEAGT